MIDPQTWLQQHRGGPVAPTVPTSPIAPAGPTTDPMSWLQQHRGTQQPGQGILTPPAPVSVKPQQGPLQRVTGALGQVGRVAWTPVRVAMDWMGKPAEWTEQAISHVLNVKDYNELFDRAGVKNDAMRGVLSTAARIVLDPTNLLLAPGSVAKGLSLAGRVASATMKTADAMGLAAPIAKAASEIEHAFMTGKTTGPIMQRVTDLAMDTHKVFNRTAGLPPEVAQALREWHAGTVDAGRSAIELKREILARIPDDTNRKMLSHAIERVTRDVPYELSPELGGHLKWLNGVSEGLTGRAVQGGYIDHAVQNYIKHMYPREDLAAKMSAQLRGRSIAEAGPSSVGGRQMIPGPRPLGTTIRSSKRRTFPTISDAIAAGLHPIEDVGVLIPAHALELGLAENNARFLKAIGKLGPQWVQHAGEAPQEWTALRHLVGNPTAQRIGLEHMSVHPELGGLLRDLISGPNYRGVMGMVGRTTGALKQLIFFNPLFHAGNVWRSAFLAEGPRMFSPSYFKDWRAAVNDAREAGPLFRDFLAHGGSVSASAGRELRSTVEEILSSGPSAQAMGRSGIDIREILKHPLQLPGVLRNWSDDILWHQIDRGSRLVAYKHFVDQGIEKGKAAQLATMFLNDYSRESLSNAERRLAQLFFTYAWNKGRLKLAGNMARSFLPGGDPAMTRMLQAATTRWAAAHVVMPHIIRAYLGRPGRGIYGGTIPAGTEPTPSGRGQREVFIKPTGFYGDAVEFLRDPGVFAWSRTNPMLRTAFDAINAGLQAHATGGSFTEAGMSAAAQTFASYLPAGVPQMVTPGRPLPLRLAQFVGIPTTVVPPPPDDPKIQFHEALMNGDYATAAKIAAQAGQSITQLSKNLPYDQRRKLLYMYHLLAPRITK